MRLNLADHYLGYYDTAGRDQDPSDKHINESGNLVLDLLSISFAEKGLAIPELPLICQREKVRKYYHH